MNSDLVAMDRLLRTDSEFLTFVANKAKEHEINSLELRKEALQRAIDNLKATEVVRLSRKEYKNAKNLCARNDWSEEHVKDMLAEYRKQKPTMKALTKKSRNVFDGLKNIGQAIAL